VRERHAAPERLANERTIRAGRGTGDGAAHGLGGKGLQVGVREDERVAHPTSDGERPVIRIDGWDAANRVVEQPESPLLTGRKGHYTTSRKQKAQGQNVGSGEHQG